MDDQARDREGEAAGSADRRRENLVTDNTPTLDTLVRDLGRVLNLDAVDPDVALGELGIDSLNVIELILICEQIYPTLADPGALSVDQYTTLRALDRQLLDQQALPVEG